MAHSYIKQKENDLIRRGIGLPIRRRVLEKAGPFLPLVGHVKGAVMLKADDYVMFLPDIAYQQQDGSVVAGVQVWVYEKQRRFDLTRVLAMLLGIDISSLDDDERRRLYERSQLFRVDSEGGKRLDIVDEASNHYGLPRTAASGRANQLIVLPAAVLQGAQSHRLTFSLDGKAMPAGTNEAVAFFAPRQGFSVISDIDDTIKQSFVRDTKRLLRNTFLEEYRAVEGVSDWYRALAARGNVAFHYVSSSPIQLYPALNDFMRREKFPEGSIHLREATRWTGIIPRGSASRRHKMKAIERLLRAYPQRHFIMIGDSGEGDAPIYADFMRRYPRQIRAICIRDVTPQIGKETYDRIFATLNRQRWLVSADVDAMRRFIEMMEGELPYE